MPDEKVKKQLFYKVPFSERNARFLRSLSDATRKRLGNRVMHIVVQLIENLKQGKEI